MPRKSSASSDVLQITRPIQRPTPPSDLTPKQAAQWNKYVDCFPVEYFDPPAQILLKELCRAVDFCDHYAAWLNDHPIETLQPKDLRQHQKTMAAYLKASHNVEMYSVRLRLLPISRIQTNHAAHMSGRTGAKPLASERRPWDRIFPVRGDQGDGGAA